MDVRGRDAEQSGDPPLRHDQALARRIDRQLVAVPRRDDGVRLHGVVILRRRFVGRLDPRRCRGETCLDVAVTDLGGIADADHGRHETLAAIEPDAGRLRLVARRQQRGAFGRGLQRLGDHHRDRLVGVAHLVVLQQIEPEHERIGLGVRIFRKRRPVRRCHHLDDAGMALGRVHIEEADAAARDAADREHRMQHAGRMIVGGEAGLAGDLQHAVAAGQRLADVRAVAGMGGICRQGQLRHSAVLRQRRRRARREAPACGPACRQRRASARAPGCGAPVRS